jgi:xylitol oxidase
MNKRTFLKLSSATIAIPTVSRLLAWAAPDKLTNWAGNLEYSTENLHAAKSLEQIQEFVKKQPKLKVLGSRHCFNNIADSKDTFLSLKPLDEIVSLDPQARTVTVDAGITYGQLAPLLDAKGFALHNLASLPHISVAGACTTATHGSGEKNGNHASKTLTFSKEQSSASAPSASLQKLLSISSPPTRCANMSTKISPSAP